MHFKTYKTFPKLRLYVIKGSYRLCKIMDNWKKEPWVHLRATRSGPNLICGNIVLIYAKKRSKFFNQRFLRSLKMAKKTLSINLD